MANDKAMDSSSPVTSVSGTPITFGDVITHLKSTGAFRNAVYELIEAAVVKEKCAELSVDMPADDFHVYADGRRRQLGVTDAVAMNNYCRWLGITFDQWQHSIEADLRKQRLARRVTADPAMREHLAQQAEALRSITLSRIVCAQEEDAIALRHRIEQGGEEFFALAREHSLETSTRKLGGYLGTVTRGMLQSDVDAAIFAVTAPGSLVGPLKESGFWTLYEVTQIYQCSAEDERVKAQVFRTWLDGQVRQARP